MACGFSNHRRVGRDIADVVGHLVGLAQPLAQRKPGFGRGTGRQSARRRGRGEQGTCFGALVVGQRDPRFAFPGLARHDAERHADALGNGAQQRRQAKRRFARRRTQSLKRQHDERVTGQHRQAFAVRKVHRSAAPAGGGVVKTRQVVVNQRGTVQQLDGAGGGFAQFGVVVATGCRHGQTQLRAHPRASRKHGVAYGTGQFGRATLGFTSGDRRGQRLFDSGDGFHAQTSCPVTTGKVRGKVSI